MCLENTSPRLSFSNDLSPADVVPVDHDEYRRDSKLLDMNSDFEFRIASSFQQESSSADELFANGVILPVQIQERNIVYSSKQGQKCSPPPISSLPPLPRPSCNDNNPKKEFYSLKETMVMKNDFEEKPPHSKSFWGFKRSSSLNCDAKKSLISSLSLLSRSNSTGSASNKRTSLKDFQKHNSQKFQGSSTCASASSNPYQLRSKKKNYGESYANGVKISHVLNMPPPYVYKGAANLFGLGSFLRSGCGSKDNKRNKK